MDKYNNLEIRLELVRTYDLKKKTVELVKNNSYLLYYINVLLITRKAVLLAPILKDTILRDMSAPNTVSLNDIL